MKWRGTVTAFIKFRTRVFGPLYKRTQTQPLRQDRYRYYIPVTLTGTRVTELRDSNRDEIKRKDGNLELRAKFSNKRKNVPFDTFHFFFFFFFSNLLNDPLSLFEGLSLVRS